MAQISWLLLLYVFAGGILPQPGVAIVLGPVEHLSPEHCAPSNSLFHKYCNCTRGRGLNCGDSIEVEFTCCDLLEFFEEGFVSAEVQCL